MSIAVRALDPEMFRSLMAYQWARGTAYLLAGLFVLGFDRHLDTFDPFHKRFKGNAAFDDLDRALEEERRRR
jgi:hypothetical protein